LQERGHDVIGIDLEASPNITSIMADITKPLPAIDPIDAVIHLAAIASPNICNDDPDLAFNVNVHGTLQVLRFALASGASKFVFSSSAHVYDIPPKYLPTDEVHPLRLNNTYTTTKLLGEQLCQLFYENYGLSYTTLRLFNAYGPGQMPGYFIPDMIEKAQTGSIELKGHATTKDWVYVDDVARAFCLAVKTPFVGSINIGTGVDFDLGYLAKMIAKKFGAEFTRVGDGSGSRMRADYSRAYKVLGWQPNVKIEDGLDVTINATQVRSPA